jgi:hypothetical protein
MTSSDELKEYVLTSSTPFCFTEWPNHRVGSKCKADCQSTDDSNTISWSIVGSQFITNKTGISL